MEMRYSRTMTVVKEVSVVSKLALAALLAASLTGCGGLSGNAVYKYTKTGEDCTLMVDTGRVLAAGIQVELTECNVTVDAGKVEQGGNTIGDMVQLLGLLKTPVPEPVLAPPPPAAVLIPVPKKEE